MTEEPMDAEFDTVAAWTADVALALGPSSKLPAACRGSGSPPALDWLLDRLRPSRGEAMVDIGAGVGGPADYLARRTRARPLLVEPAAGACRAARRLFAHPVVRADAVALPVPTSSVDTAWCLGVLCTTSRKHELLTEARRIVRPGGRFGLLVFVATHPDPPDQPEGNEFPLESDLRAELDNAGFAVDAEISLSDLPAADAEWKRAEDDVEAEFSRRYGHKAAWQTAQEQADRMGRLLSDGDLAGRLLVCR